MSAVPGHGHSIPTSLDRWKVSAWKMEKRNLNREGGKSGYTDGKQPIIRDAFLSS